MIRATIVLLAARVIIPRLRHRSAAERHLFWAVSLAMAAVLPLLGSWLPPWQPEWASRLVESLPASLGAFVDWGSARAPEVVVRATGLESGNGGTVWSSIAILWAAGTSLAAASLFVRLVRLGHLPTTTLPTDDRGRRIAADIARTMGLDRPPVLLRSPKAAVPMTWGARKCHVLLPEASAAWPDDRLEAVLAHEIAHVQRGDWMAHLVAQSLCALYWFHPLFWIAEHHMGREAEQAADDAALVVGLDGASYAEHLLAVVRASRTPVHGPVAAMARSPHLEARVRALLSANANRAPLRHWQIAATGAIASAFALPLAAMTNRASFEVEIRTMNLPRVFSYGRLGPQPMLPVVRAVGSRPAQGTDPGQAPAISEYTTPPLYSDDARRHDVEGVVTVGARITADGRVASARVLKGLGFGLDQNALVAVRQWRFAPGTRAGRPVEMDVEVDVEFSLQGDQVDREPSLHGEPTAHLMAAELAAGLWLLRERESGGRSPAMESGHGGQAPLLVQDHEDAPLQWLRRSSRATLRRNGSAKELLKVRPFGHTLTLRASARCIVLA